MSHASAWRCGLTRNESDHRFGNVFFNVVGGFIFGGPADFTDHANGFGAPVSLEQFQYIDELCTDDGVAANSHTGGLADSQLGQLSNGFIRQGSTAGNDADIALFMNVSGHDPDLRFTRGNDTRAIGPD